MNRAALDRATAALDPPFAVVDLDAFDANAADLLRRAGATAVRLASKSVRCRALQRRALDAGLRGQLCFTLPEALWLADHGFDDLVVAYPTADRGALRALAHGPHRGAIAVMVDSRRAPRPRRGGRRRPRARVPGRRRRLVAAGRADQDRRQALARAHARAGRRAGGRRGGAAGDRARGLMSYEAHIAGVGDAPPGRRAYGAAVRAMQRASARELAARRAAVVAAVRAVRAAGVRQRRRDGLVERTAAEAAVTEVTAGSGLYGPTLFDAYRGFDVRPAALFALPVVRKPAPASATVLGGGYLASGAAGADRLPRPVLPAGLRLDRAEGAGEVQTPVLGAAARDLALGDRVWFRHAKAGELCERFAGLHLVRGEEIVDEVATYRGEGQTFL